MVRRQRGSPKKKPSRMGRPRPIRTEKSVTGRKGTAKPTTAPRLVGNTANFSSGNRTPSSSAAPNSRNKPNTRRHPRGQRNGLDAPNSPKSMPNGNVTFSVQWENTQRTVRQVTIGKTRLNIFELNIFFNEIFFRTSYKL